MRPAISAKRSRLPGPQLKSIRAARYHEPRADVPVAGSSHETRTMLSETYFTEGFDIADLKDAKALLDELAE
jgi:hypothetical protein